MRPTALCLSGILLVALLLFSTCAVDGARTNFDVVGINLDGALPSNFSLVNFKTGSSKVLAQVPPVSSNMGFNGAVFAVSDQLFIIAYYNRLDMEGPTFMTSINPFTGAVKANVTIPSAFYGFIGLQWDEDSRLVYGFAFANPTWKFVSCNPFTGVTQVLWDTGFTNINADSSSTFDPDSKRYFASYGEMTTYWWITIPVENPSQAQKLPGIIASSTDLAYDATTDLISTNYFAWDKQWQFYFAVVDASNSNKVSHYNLSGSPQGQVQFPYFNPGVAADGHFFSPVTLLQSNGLNTGIWTLDEATGQIVDFVPTETSFATCCVSWTTSS